MSDSFVASMPCSESSDWYAEIEVCARALRHVDMLFATWTQAPLACLCHNNVLVRFSHGDVARHGCRAYALQIHASSSHALSLNKTAGNSGALQDSGDVNRRAGR
ncbi:hypothetical protein EJ03DRAFT_178254 [Teratosphaeria nubilosa]|uniref:Uncharacterized protein n=1 Tax=Teratosphaeria nubilosa TaxID=161662 RepID=A0A6G1L1M0_9PEZI|nr:hypothetical protein EJ03DRAFT_178254 [Teratosphaeria nubilosa]